MLDADRHGYPARPWMARILARGRQGEATATYERKGEAREALNQEFDRIRLGTAYQAPITLRELSDRFLVQYSPSPRTNYYVKLSLKRPLDA